MASIKKSFPSSPLFLITLTIFLCCTVFKHCDATLCYSCHDEDGQVKKEYRNCRSGVPLPIVKNRPFIFNCPGKCVKYTAENPDGTVFHVIKTCSQKYTECLKVGTDEKCGCFFGTMEDIQKCSDMNLTDNKRLADNSDSEAANNKSIQMDMALAKRGLFGYDSETKYKFWECDEDLCNGANAIFQAAQHCKIGLLVTVAVGVLMLLL